ncbi:hypothetical protein Vretifemale_21066 [Volvox reticuliferus]|uniref:Uncharacterized protein n=1 Tax=Volvox reticuliferus TaxID=1737510 RepID=A0A8J4G055_9CHLO|nr:hypothetical protein Vretifemale_20896 [Volvox reticuliferus]GIL93614.1 hypothetical protein Vretifemale_21012 [Volvox reticuliferus]GIL93673.1 hypothetical protein Vretifemale_21066 [Volvox reticuliferus]
MKSCISLALSQQRCRALAGRRQVVATLPPASAASVCRPSSICRAAVTGARKPARAAPKAPVLVGDRTITFWLMEMWYDNIVVQQDVYMDETVRVQRLCRTWHCQVPS